MLCLSNNHSYNTRSSTSGKFYVKRSRLERQNNSFSQGLKLNAIAALEKKDPPHQLELALCIIKGDIPDSGCTCIAGKVRFCNHISAMMLKVCKFTLFELKTTKDLQEENDENPALAFTLQLQKWNKKDCGENIVPQPVMEENIKKTKLDDPSTSCGGVKCPLYEAPKQPEYDEKSEHSFKTTRRN